nr:MAG TPA: protein of unknown function (DUF2155) [Caudoviricetes sp.]
MKSTAKSIGCAFCVVIKIFGGGMFENFRCLRSHSADRYEIFLVIVNL